MGSNFRPVINSNRTPVQQSLAIDTADYSYLRTDKLLIGVVLEVFYSDDPHNKSSMASNDGRGAFAECKVLIVGTDNTTQFVIDHVVITPTGSSGLDNFCEDLPRGTTGCIDGTEYTTTMDNVDANMLNGDWCVVGFLGSNQDRPFILKWWPHPKNYLDQATSGQGNPDTSGNPKALNQKGRYFTRKNGVETLITAEGDVYLSTKQTAGTLRYSDINQPKNGRWERDISPDDGGSIQLQMKTSGTLELVWDDVQDGHGIRFRSDPIVPQTNPKPGRTQPDYNTEKCYLYFSDETIDIKVPISFSVTGANSILLSSEDESRIKAKNVLELDSTTIKLGTNADTALQGVARGEDLRLWLQSLTVLTATGPAQINPVDIETFRARVLSTKVFIE